MVTKGTVRLRVEIADATLSDDEKASLAQSLARELRGLEVVEEVGPATDKVPKGARPIEEITWGALLLVLAPIALDQLIDFLRSWSGRPGGQRTNISIQVGDRSIEGEYDPATMSPSEIEELAKRLRGVIAD